MKKWIISAFILSTASSIWAQQNPLDSLQTLSTVFIDSKVNLDRKNSGKTITVINKETLQRNAGKTVAQLLSEVSGFEINGSQSNQGQNLGYFVRGGRNRQVLVIIDGVAINDASQIANDFDLRLLPLASIEKIEILKGASSVLYGSGAGTAVISITTKKNAKKPFSVAVESNVGTDRPTENNKYAVQAINNHVNVSGQLNKLNYQFMFSHRYSNGLSAVASPVADSLFESDTFKNYSAQIRLGYQFNEKTNISRFIAVDEMSADFDAFTYQDANNNNLTNQLRTGGNFTWKYNKGSLVINDNFNFLEREIQSDFSTQFDAFSFNVDAFLQHNLISNLKMVIGLNASTNTINAFSIPFGETDFVNDIDSDKASFTNLDPYINAVFTSNFGFSLHTGARLNNHNLYGANWVYNINPSYYFEVGKVGVKALSSYSSAYITPSLFQLFDPSFGNVDLLAEENITLEGGVELTYNKLRFSALYFSRAEENFIDFVTVDPDNFVFQYQNTNATFSASGTEIEFEAPLFNKMQLTANYTFTQPDQQFALRIPKHMANLQINYLLTEKTRFNLSGRYVSSRTDSFFNSDTFESETVTLKEYSLVNFFVSQKFSNQFSLFLGIDNLLDTEFEEVFRFQARGRNVRLGFTINL